MVRDLDLIQLVVLQVVRRALLDAALRLCTGENDDRRDVDGSRRDEVSTGRGKVARRVKRRLAETGRERCQKALGRQRPARGPSIRPHSWTPYRACGRPTGRRPCG